MWFHRYEDGHDIEGRFDYNSWQESEQGLKLAASLDKDVVLAEGMHCMQATWSGASTDLSQVTKSTTPVENTWPAWVIGETIKTWRFL